MMEKYNQEGPPQDGLKAVLPAPSPDQFQRLQEAGMQIVDTRSPEAFIGTFIPGSLGDSVEHASGVCRVAAVV